MKKIIRSFFYNPCIAKQISRILAKIHQLSYLYLGSFASAAEGGLHPKHRLMDYHKFFVDNIMEGESVLDVGCGNGALLRDVVSKSKARATGIELSEENCRDAKKRLTEFNEVKIIQEDIWKFNCNEYFDVIILSNVLEHLEKRTDLLKHLIRNFMPKKILLRVPMFEREWLVPYKRELDIEWRLDPTHWIEYTEEEFQSELAAAGLDIQKLIFRWGEMYAVAVPSSKERNA